MNATKNTEKDLIVYPKQGEAIQAMRPGKKNIALLNGPRRSGKTVGGLIGLCERAWYLRRNNTCILSITQSAGTDSGIWDVLTTKVLPKYIASGSMRWVEEPHNRGTTKIPCFSVTNQFGGVSTFEHRSLKVEDEVEDRFKGPEFTTIFVNELSKFYNLKTFTILLGCLRGMDIPEEEMLFCADTNPSDEGEDSWIWKVFYGILSKDEDELEDWEKPLRNKLKVIEFSINDNLGMSQDQKDLLFASLGGDPGMVQRYWFGRWVRTSSDAVFAKTFRPNFHVVGELPTPANLLPEILVPSENCVELVEGWDPGGSANWAMVQAEEFYRPEITRHRGRPSFKILDEHVVIGQQVDYVAFVQDVLKKRRVWENQIDRQVRWTSYSDRSVLSMKDLESEKHYAQLIYEASEGEIELKAVERNAGSVRAGVDLLKMLLFEERLWINLASCPHLIDALKSIRPGKSTNEALDKVSKFKHVIDGLRYLLQAICYRELTLSTVVTMRKKNEPNSSLVWTPT